MNESKRRAKPSLSRNRSDSDREDSPASPLSSDDVLDGGAGGHSPDQPIEELYLPPLPRNLYESFLERIRNVRFKGAGIGFIAAFIITGLACFLCPPGNAIITIGLIAFWGSLGGGVGAIIGAVIDNHSFACLSSQDREDLDASEEYDYNEGQGRYSFIGSMRSTWTSLKERLANAVHRAPADPAPVAAPAVPPAPASSCLKSFIGFFQRTPPAAQPAVAPQADLPRASQTG